jgi:hypothetical protein
VGVVHTSDQDQLRLRYIVVCSEFRVRGLERGRMHILRLMENEHMSQDSTAVL